MELIDNFGRYLILRQKRLFRVSKSINGGLSQIYHKDCQKLLCHHYFDYILKDYHPLWASTPEPLLKDHKVKSSDAETSFNSDRALDDAFKETLQWCKSVSDSDQRDDKMNLNFDFNFKRLTRLVSTPEVMHMKRKRADRFKNSLVRRAVMSKIKEEVIVKHKLAY